MIKTLIIIALLLLNGCSENRQYAELLEIEKRCLSYGGNYDFKNNYCKY